MTSAVLSFFTLGMFDPAINTTFIALIPKVEIAGSVNDYWPISLCNVHKIINIAKVLANRLKVLLPHIISP